MRWAGLGWAGPHYPSVHVRDGAKGRADQAAASAVCILSIAGDGKNLALHYSGQSLSSPQKWFLKGLSN